MLVREDFRFIEKELKEEAEIHRHLLQHCTECPQASVTRAVSCRQAALLCQSEALDHQQGYPILLLLWPDLWSGCLKRSAGC